MAYVFEWDHAKAKANLRKHGVSFEEASTVFGDIQSITVHDPSYNYEEDRFVDIGFSVKLRILVVVYTEKWNRIRIISARKATAIEQKNYEEK